MFDLKQSINHVFQAKTGDAKEMEWQISAVYYMIVP